MAHWKEKINENIFEEVSLIDLIIYWVKNQAKYQTPNFEKKINFLSYFLHFHLSKASSIANPLVNNIFGQSNHPMYQLKAYILFSSIYLNRI